MPQNAKRLLEASLELEIPENKAISKLDKLKDFVDSPQELFVDHFRLLYEKTLNTLIGANEKETKQEYFKWLDFNYLREASATSSNLAKALKNKGINNLFVVGMGGSGINALVLKNAFYDHGQTNGKAGLYVQNNLDPSSLLSKLDELKASDKLAKTAFTFISKSGGTDEVKRNLYTILDFLHEVYGSDENAIEQFAKQAVFITENNPGNFLCKLKEEIKSKLKVEIPFIEHHPEIGGRFSMFSPVGLFVAHMLELDANKLLIGAEDCWKDLVSQKALEKSQIGKSALYDIIFFRQGYRNKYSMVYSDSLEALNKFRAQLRGESLNKNGIDSTMHVPGTGTINHHSDLEMLFKDQNQVILEQIVFAEPARDHRNTYDTLKSIEELEGQSNYQSLLQGHVLPIYDYLSQNGHPVIMTVIDKHNEQSLGYFLMHDMLSTVMQAGLQDRLDDSIRQKEVERYKVQVKKQTKIKKDK